MSVRHSPHSDVQRTGHVPRRDVSGVRPKCPALARPAERPVGTATGPMLRAGVAAASGTRPQRPVSCFSCGQKWPQTFPVVPVRGARGWEGLLCTQEAPWQQLQCPAGPGASVSLRRFQPHCRHCSLLRGTRPRGAAVWEGPCVREEWCVAGGSVYPRHCVSCFKMGSCFEAWMSKVLNLVGLTQTRNQQEC